MNLRNEADIALDEAFKDHLKGLFKVCLIGHGDERACTALLEGLKKASEAYYAANKALDTL